MLLFGDTAQLPPISDKVLFHNYPANDIALQGYCAYQQFCLVFMKGDNKTAGCND